MTVQQPSTQPPQSRWIWPFELLEQIGEGGMGVVYRARYVVNDRQVALKMLPSDVKDETVLARFERETEVLKTLKHPNIVRCFGGACEDKRRFYAMELVEGGTLEDKLHEKRKLPWEQVVYYGLQMCAALDFSHQQGVVHRDVKPSNFLLTSTGKLKLSDFGLASVAAARKITAAGKTAGTYLYMAPEQIRGKTVTPKTDLYALGCVLYELITGQPPFMGDTPAATLHLHCHEPAPRPTQKALDCPISLERIILQLLEKDPQQRPDSAAAVARALKGVNLTVSVVSPQRELSAGEKTQETTAELVRQKSDRNIRPQDNIRLGNRTGIALAVLLFLSISLNVFQFLGASNNQHWEQTWIEAASHPNLAVRLAAVEALGKASTPGSDSLTALQSGLRDAEPAIRIQSAQGLAHAGAAAREAVPALMKAQKTDPRNEVRDAAEQALVTIRGAQSRGGFPWTAVIGLGLLAVAGGAYLHWSRTSAEAS